MFYETILDATKVQGVNKESVIGTICEIIDASATRVAKKRFLSDSKSCIFSLIPAKFSCFQFMDDHRFHYKDVVSAEKIKKKDWSENVNFDELVTPRSDYTISYDIFVQATRTKLPKNNLSVENR